MEYSIKLKRSESLIYIILWITVLLMPIFISNTDTGINWLRVKDEWIRILPFFTVFLLHNYLLFPKLFMQKKRILFFVSVVLLILLTGLFMEGFDFLFHAQNRSFINIPRVDMPHMERQPRGSFPPMGRVPHEIPFRILHKALIDVVLVASLVVGFNLAIKLIIIWQDEEQKNKELEKEKLKTELAFLKNQVSPHFFMNTLHNIHSLIDINSEDAKQSVIQLSKLMRYLLYDTEKGQTTLQKEIEFIKSYIDLMKLRYTSAVKIKLSLPDDIKDVEIPPMLFTSLLENAFKHGISYQKKSFVDVILNLDEEFLYFTIVNSKNVNVNGFNEPGGLGLDNLKKRMDLIYDGRYSLEQKDDDDRFEINIKLPING